jgi:hypothetical protein
MRVRGTSMAPAVQPSDWLIVDTARRPRFGDIVVVERDGHLVSHRVIGWRARCMRGDAADAVEHFLPDHIVGTAVALVHGSTQIDLCARRARWTGRRIATRSWCAATAGRLRTRARSFTASVSTAGALTERRNP